MSRHQASATTRRINELLLMSATFICAVITAADVNEQLVSSSSLTMTQCCVDQTLSESCAQHLCSESHQPQSTSSSTTAAPAGYMSLACYFDIHKIFQCLSGVSNMTQCCDARHVTSRCHRLCSGDVQSVLVSDIDCLNYLPDIAVCFRQTFESERLPPPPSRLAVVSVTSSKVVLSWTNDGSTLQSYIVQYRERDGGNLGPITYLTLSANRQRTVEVTIDDLSSQTLYTASVVAVNDRGHSWPSSPVTFLTYPPLQVSAQSSSRRLPSDELMHHVAHWNDTIGLYQRQQQQHRPDDELTGPVDVLVTHRTAFSLSLSWTPPAAGPSHHQIIAYHVHYTTSVDSVITDMLWRLVVVRDGQTQVILSDLLPDTAYSVVVVALSTIGPGSPSPTVTTRTLPDHILKRVDTGHDLSGCCRTHNVSAECSAVCSGRGGLVDLRVCADDLIHVVQCAATDGDARTRQCCGRKVVPDECLKYCDGSSSSSVTGFYAVLCLAFMDEILSCFRPDDGLTPPAPSGFEVTEIGLTSATFIWYTDDSDNDMETLYHLHYQLITTSTTDNDRYHVVQNVRSPFTLDGLLPSGEYSVYIIAVNSFGVSEPSTVISVSLHSVANANPGVVQIIQSPPGVVAIGSSLQLTCVYSLTSSATGSDVTVSWHRGDETVIGQWYLIDSVQPQDGGRYTCIVQLTHGHVMSSDVIVRVQFAPVATPVQRQVLVGINHTAHLICMFTGQPNSISWSRVGDAAMPLVNSRYSVTRYLRDEDDTVDSQLSIEAVTATDYGLYRCTGSNVYATAEAFISLSGVSIYASPAPTQPSHVTPQIEQCCSAYRVSPECLDGCRSDLTWNHVKDLGAQCAVELPKLLSCTATDPLDHSHCCAARSVPRDCLTLCRGRRNVVVTSHVHVTCLSHVPTIIDCLHQTLDDVPSQPINVRLSLTSSGHVEVTWDKPEVNADLVESYRVDCVTTSTTSRRNHSLTTVDRTATVRDVIEFTTYYVIVTASGHDVISLPSTPVHISTFELAPSEPRRVAVEVRRDGVSATVSWLPPEQYSEFVVGYRVHHADAVRLTQLSTQRVAGDVTRLVMDELSPSTRYVVYVTALSLHYVSLPSDELYFTTTPDVTSESVDKVTLAVCLVVLCIATIVVIVVARHYCTRSSKPLSQSSRLTSESLERLNYSRLSDGEVVRWSAADSHDVTRSEQFSALKIDGDLQTTPHHHQQLQQQSPYQR